jgi:hypothetical protein
VALGCFCWGQVEKVIRGGSWNNNWNNLRVANRNNNNPDNRNNNIGFRCGVSPDSFLKSQVRRLERAALSLRVKVTDLFPVGQNVGQAVSLPYLTCPTKDKPLRLVW